MILRQTAAELFDTLPTALLCSIHLHFAGRKAASDVVSGVVVTEARLDSHVKFGDSSLGQTFLEICDLFTL